VDVYETLVAYDFEARLRALAALAGADPLAWQQDQLQRRKERDCGLVSTAESFRLSMSACGIDPSPQLVSDLTLADRDLMVANSQPYDDAVPFLRQLRSNGIKIALVSNCPDNTRTLLTDLDLAPLADHVILSCEIGFAKPSPEIYAYALEMLGMPPEAAVMVDDLEEYCKGAEAAGVKAVRITRNGQSADSGSPAVRSLLDVLDIVLRPLPGGAHTEAACAAAQSLARAALTRCRTSGSGGVHCLASIPAGCGLRGSAVPGALSGAGAGSRPVSGRHAALLCDGWLLIAGGVPSLRWSMSGSSCRWPLLNRSSDQMTLPPDCGDAYQFHCWLSVATRNSPRPPSSASGGVPSSPRPGRTGGRGSASQTSMSSRSLSLDRRSRTGSGISRPAVAFTALVTSSLFTELAGGFLQFRGHAGGFGVRDFCFRGGYVLLPCSRRLRFPVTW